MAQGIEEKKKKERKWQRQGRLLNCTVDVETLDKKRHR